jgi:hypothetical protein
MNELVTLLRSAIEPLISEIVDKKISERAQATELVFATIRTAARRYDRTEKAIQRMIETGKLKSYQIDARVQIKVSEADNLFSPVAQPCSQGEGRS